MGWAPALFAALATLWWWLGLDFLALPLLGILSLVSGAFTPGRRVRIPALGWWIAFLVWALLSLVVNGESTAPFSLRSLLSYAAFPAILWGAQRIAQRLGPLPLVRGVSWGVLTAHIVGITATILQWPPPFWALGASRVPPAILLTELGQQALFKEAVRLKGSPLLGQVEVRVGSLFSFENYYALAALVGAVAGWWLWKKGKRGDRVLGATLLSLTPFAIYGARSRSALVALVVVGVWVWASRDEGGVSRGVRGAVVALVATLGLGVALLSGWASEVSSFREASNERRIDIYRETVLATAGRPLLGYGAPADPGLVRGGTPSGFHLGSHSEPLAILFRFGFVGALFYSLGVLGFWRRLRDHQSVPTKAAMFLLGVISIQSLFITLTLDGTPVAWALLLVGAAKGAKS